MSFYNNRIKHTVISAYFAVYIACHSYCEGCIIRYKALKVIFIDISFPFLFSTLKPVKVLHDTAWNKASSKQPVLLLACLCCFTNDVCE